MNKYAISRILPRKINFGENVYHFGIKFSSRKKIARQTCKIGKYAVISYNYVVSA